MAEIWHHCPVPACTRTAPPKTLMCPDCWRTVTPSTRSKVGATFRAWSSDLGNKIKYASYRAAKTDAIAEAARR